METLTSVIVFNTSEFCYFLCFCFTRQCSDTFKVWWEI